MRTGLKRLGTVVLVVLPSLAVAGLAWLFVIGHPLAPSKATTATTTSTTTPAAEATEIAAALTATGAGVTASVTLVGLLFRRSLDERSEARERETGRRLQIDAAMQAVKLLAVAEGKVPDTVQSSAALIAICNLGDVSLTIALGLADELWPLNRISTSAAVAVIDRALGSDDSELRYTATLLLHRNQTALELPNDEYEWPQAFYEWPSNEPEEIRVMVAATVHFLCEHSDPEALDRKSRLLRAAKLDRSELVRRAATASSGGVI